MKAPWVGKGGGFLSNGGRDGRGKSRHDFKDTLRFFIGQFNNFIGQIKELWIR
jgi:hypothetical protein